jgi:hypothetical protein
VLFHLRSCYEITSFVGGDSIYGFCRASSIDLNTFEISYHVSKHMDEEVGRDRGTLIKDMMGKRTILESAEISRDTFSLPQLSVISRLDY